MPETKNSPIAICISDIHFNVNNLELATKALQAAIGKAEELRIPLVIAGDLHDTKAIIRAEVANRLIEILRNSRVQVYVIVGNHDLINEKGSQHGLNYLRPHVGIVDFPWWISLSGKRVLLVPYLSNPHGFFENPSANFSDPPPIIIMHQGFMGAAMGDYIQDKTSISPYVVKDSTVISGHYHKHQTIGTVTYIGSPFTHTFGEANDGSKGFLILNSDGSFTREILNLRKHVIVERPIEDAFRPEPGVNSNDLLWLKITGAESQLKKLKKEDLGSVYLGHSNFKLDLISTSDVEPVKPQEKPLTNSEIFDNIINALNETEEQKENLKKLWRSLV